MNHFPVMRAIIDPCNRPYKYQIVLDEHVIEHMNKLKELTDDERLQFLRKVLKILLMA